MTDVYLRQRWFDPRLSHSNMTEALDLAGKVKIKSKKSQSIPININCLYRKSNYFLKVRKSQNNFFLVFKYSKKPTTFFIDFCPSLQKEWHLSILGLLDSAKKTQDNQGGFFK